MSVALLDVNVLVALFDPAHPNHDDAHQWFAANRKRGWASCPLAVHHGGRLATFGRSIPLRGVVGAGPKHLDMLGA